jgi:hypothetical protein
MATLHPLEMGVVSLLKTFYSNSLIKASPPITTQICQGYNLTILLVFWGKRLFL